MSSEATSHWDGQADALFPHEVILTEPGVLNNYGRRVDGVAPVTCHAHVEYKMRQVRDVKGELTASSITVYLSGAGGVVGVTPEWTITLPDGTSRPIVSVDRYADETGDLFEVVRLQ